MTYKNNILENISSGVYIEALQHFKQLICYANILNDWNVDYESTSLSLVCYF